MFAANEPKCTARVTSDSLSGCSCAQGAAGSALTVLARHGIKHTEAAYREQQALGVRMIAHKQNGAFTANTAHLR
jgi:hypothetical protein